MKACSRDKGATGAGAVVGVGGVMGGVDGAGGLDGAGGATSDEEESLLLP